jgi:hypothetical protein
VASYLASSAHYATWGLIAFPEELKELDQEYEKIMEDLTGDNTPEAIKRMTNLGNEKEGALRQKIIDLTEDIFSNKGKTKAERYAGAAAEPESSFKELEENPSPHNSLKPQKVTKIEGQSTKTADSRCVVS